MMKVMSMILYLPWLKNNNLNRDLIPHFGGSSNPFY